MSSLRRVFNCINLSTPLGLSLARLGGAATRPGPRGLIIAEGYGLGFPRAGAFTVGNVVLIPGTLARLEARHPRVLEHEDRHATQWTYCLGLPFLPVYVATMGWSWLRTGDQAAGSFFEREAGLAIGGYHDAERRPLTVGLREMTRLLWRRG